MEHLLKNRVVSNATWIISCRVFQALLNLIISMLTARYLGPSNYGTINYAAAIVAFFIPVMQLGFRSTLVQEYIEKTDQEGLVLGTSTVLNIISSAMCILGVFLFASIANKNEVETIIVCMLYSISLLFQATEMIQYWFQAKLLSKYTSLVSLGTYAAISVYKIFLLVSGKSIYWFAIVNALDYCIISFILFFIYKRMGTQSLSFSFDMAKKLLDRSKYYIVSSMMVAVFGHVGSVVLGLCMTKEAVGFYTAAITCAGMTSFVFNALIDSARPVILSQKKTNEIKYQKSMTCLFSLIIYLAISQSIFICVFSNFIVNILYGHAYQATVEPLRIIAWYVIFSYLGPVRNIWILAEGKQKYLWRVNLSGAIVSIMLNLVLIPVAGINGAAIAALVTQFFTNVLTGCFIKPLKQCNELMLRGLNPHNLYVLIKVLVKS